MSKLIQKINNLPRTYFTINDLKKISTIKETSLKVGLSRLVNSGKIIRLVRGYYASDLTKVNFEEFSLIYNSPNYLSLEWALNYYGILSQQTYSLTLVTTKRNKMIEVGGMTLDYRHIQSKYFWGFVKKDNLLIAEPEKAFLDQAYLSLNGCATFDVEEMNLSVLNKNKLKKYLKIFNNKKLNNLLQIYTK